MHFPRKHCKKPGVPLNTTPHLLESAKCSRPESPFRGRNVGWISVSPPFGPFFPIFLPRNKIFSTWACTTDCTPVGEYDRRNLVSIPASGPRLGLHLPRAPSTSRAPSNGATLRHGGRPSPSAWPSRGPARHTRAHANARPVGFGIHRAAGDELGGKLQWISGDVEGWHAAQAYM